MDRGEVEVMADVDHYTLRQGEMIFHKPNEYHNLSANNRRKAVTVSERISSGIKERGDQVLTDRVMRYMEEHLAEPLSLGQLAALAGIGQS